MYLSVPLKGRGRAGASVQDRKGLRLPGHRHQVSGFFSGVANKANMPVDGSFFVTEAEARE
jgi:hypothetical protein